MTVWLSLKSLKRDSSELVILNDMQASTGFTVQAGMDWGSVLNPGIFASSIDTEGASKVGERLENRVIQFQVVCGTGDTLASVKTAWQSLEAMIVEVNKYKGLLRFRSSQYSYGVTFEVEHIDVASLWSKPAELGGHIIPTLSLTCRPYALMDAMNLLDDFSVNTFGTAGKYNNGGSDWTADAGALTNVTCGSYVLDATANLTTENRFIHTGAAHDVGDVQVTASFSPGSTITSFKGGVILKRVDASNYVEIYVDDNGVNSRLRIDKIVAGSRTNLASTNLASRISNGSYYTVIGRIENNVVFAEHWKTIANESSTPTTSTEWTFTASEATTFGMSVTGRTGIVFTPQHTDAKSKLFLSDPYVYKQDNFPDDIRLAGAIPGSVDALIDLSFTTKFSSAYDCWMLFAWSKRAKTHNYILNSGFSESATGWVVTAVSGVIGAASAISGGISGGYVGQFCGEVTCPATSDTGASYQIIRRFKKGVTYTARCYMRSAAHTTNARIKLGVSGDISTETAVALSTTWTLHSVTWTPTSDRYFAYFATGISAATATTFQIDQVEVFEGTTAPEYYNENTPIVYDTLKDGAYPAFGIIDTSPANADADAYGGYRAAWSSSGSTQSFKISPELIDKTSDDGETNFVGVWARVYIPSTTTSPIIKAYIKTPDTYQTSYTLEYGTTGKSLVVPSSSKIRTVYLGAIPLSSLGSDMNLFLEATYGVTALQLDCVYLAPLGSVTHSMSGIASTATKKFCFTLGQGRHTVQSDGRGVTESVRAYPSYAYDVYYPRKYSSPGLLGGTIKGRGDMNFLVVPMLTPIDQTDATSSSDSVPLAGVFRARVQPRVLMVGD